MKTHTNHVNQFLEHCFHQKLIARLKLFFFIEHAYATLNHGSEFSMFICKIFTLNLFHEFLGYFQRRVKFNLKVMKEIEIKFIFFIKYFIQSFLAQILIFSLNETKVKEKKSNENV